MRNRFLCTDCFFSKSESQILANSHFNPLYLHASELSDPDPELDFEFRSFTFCEEIRLESCITGFPIDKALSVLFSDLLPQFQQAEAVEQSVLHEKELADFLFGESIEIQDARFREDASKSNILHEKQLEKKLQFDIMELDLPRRELVTIREKEHGLELCFGLPNIKIPLDSIELDVEITVPYQENLLESIYKIEKVPFDFDQDNSNSNHRVSCTDSGFIYSTKIPQFELKDSIISEHDSSITKTEPFNSLLSIVDLVSEPHEEELFLSSKLDILSYISENPKCEPCDDPKPVPLNSVLDMDIINLNDNILIDKNSAIYPLKPDGTHSDLPCSVFLQEVETMDFKSNNTYKIFDDFKAMDIDTSEEFLKAEMDKAGKFYDSVVSSELALADESFKSLPTPIISDEKIKISLSTVMQELICVMKPCAYSASDGIYLDWHLLLEGACYNQICCRYTSLVEELNDYNLATELKMYENEVGIDIIGLLDESMEKIKINNCDEVLSKAQISFDEKMETFKKEVVVQKEENNGKNIGSSKASVLFKSLSQANDLNFFLGVRKEGGIKDGISSKESCVITEPIFVPKVPIQPAIVLREPIQPVNMLKDPLEKITHAPHDSTNRLSEKQTINSLNFIPTNQNIYSTSNNPSINIPSLINPNPVKPTRPNSLSDIVIIVNTNSIDKPTLISRRSSYQKILNLEKQGAHVVEREIDLPLNLVFSAGICLVWYEMGAFGKMSRDMSEGSSCIQMFMENIATDVLMSLSYSFTGCIMIFEGEINILTAVMDLSDTLYSAAANLDTNLQLLCSYTAESTDDIIMTCIAKLSSPTHNPYPPVPESETLAESFLTKFPSINSLSAHAILSSGGTLIDFLEWSNERRIQAVGKYLVSSESVGLFSALCRFGENGESKSVMTTECSSVDSEFSSSLLRSPLKRTKFAHENVDMDIPVSDELFCGKPFEKLEGDFMEFPFVEDQTKKSVSSIVDQFLGKKKETMSSSNYMDLNLNEEIKNCKNVFSEKTAFNSELSSFAFRPELRNKPLTRNSLPSKRPVFGLQTFPSSAEIDEETTSNWNSQKENYVQGSNGLETKFQNANSKQGPVWRFQFMGGEETEKRSYSSSTSSRSKETYCKTRSPSIIDSYRYQGGKELGKKAESYRYQGSKDAINPIKQKWKDFKFQPVEIPKSEKRKNSDLITPTWTPVDKRERQNPALISSTWTPVDKRARQNLSFTRQGKAKQSKLVWRKKDSPCISVGLAKRSREEGRLQNL